jgi:hypothetical protein
VRSCLPKRTPQYPSEASAVYERAQQDFEAALAADPDYRQLNELFAWQLATCPNARFRDGQRAVEIATEHVLTPSLAAGHAEMGKFDEAVFLMEHYIEKVKSSKPRPPKRL